MKITDKQVLRMIKIANSIDLSETIQDYPDDERAGRSDLQFLADEVSYRLSLYDEDTAIREEYLIGRKILRETNHGKTIPLVLPSLKPKYKDYDVRCAKEVVNEYRRLKSLMDRLNKLGYYGKW